jgi:hypothetical protein
MSYQRDRRLGFRVDLEIFLNQYIRDRPLRCLTGNLSETGIYLNRAHVPPGSRPISDARTVSLEFELPGTGELIWARGEVCHEQVDPYFCGSGVRFTGIPTIHARLVRDFCVEARRDSLGSLLRRIRGPRAPRQAAPSL